MNRLVIIVGLTLLLSGCGILHNRLHPYREHCMYHCLQAAVNKANETESCLEKDIALRLNMCESHCIMKEMGVE